MIKDALLIIFMIIGLAVSALWMVNNLYADVYVSQSTNECVKVYSNSNYTCDNLPKNYNHVWVK